MNRDRYWDAWYAEDARQLAEITAEVESILAEGYEALGETPPIRTAGHRANRDRKAGNEDS